MADQKQVLTDTQQANVTFDVRDAKGHPAQVQGTPEWSTSDPNIVSVTPSADGKSAKIVAGAPGTAQVSVTADADLGDGISNITGVADVQVNGGKASVISLKFDNVTEQA
jgi:multidrug efflux pump subunit AcrB